MCSKAAERFTTECSAGVFTVYFKEQNSLKPIFTSRILTRHETLLRWCWLFFFFHALAFISVLLPLHLFHIELSYL